MMQRSNNPDVAIAQEWAQELDAWVEANGLCGYDPFDVKQHPWIRAAQPHRYARGATTLLCDLFPHASRWCLGIVPTENPKAFALVALADLRMHALTGEPRYRERAERLLDTLLERAVSTGTGIGWGYPFDVRAQGLDTPRNTPVLVVSAIAGEAFAHAHAALGKETYAEAVQAIARFIASDLPRLDSGEGTHCFAYAPCDLRRVHNANLLAAEHLFRAGDAYRDCAEAALQFTLQRQQPDGSWAYGEAAPGDPFDPRLLALVDHHHTGFVLRSLYAIHAIRPRDDVRHALEKGFAYYTQRLFQRRRMPVQAHAAYPVDIHACAEAVLCSATLAPMFTQAERYAIGALRWSYGAMRGRGDARLYYRKYPWFCSKIAFPRWGVAWMYRALAEYLHQFAPRIAAAK